MRPRTRYARSGEVNIAYQVVGDAPRDLVLIPGWVSNIDAFWDEPTAARFFHRLASFSRLILLDKRGTGLSDRVSVAELPTLEQRMDDVRAVMEAAGSARAALYGYSEGGPMCALFAATYPERTAALIMDGSYARRIRTPEYPWAPTAAEHERFLDEIQREWGGPVGLEARAPSVATNPHFRDWWASYLRASASPGAAVALTRMNGEIDIRHILPAIRVPTLVLHRSGDRAIDVRGGRYLAERIPGARYVELLSSDHLPFVGTAADATLGEIEEFLTGARPTVEPDRVLATVMFTDIVGSTERAAALGDRGWRGLLDAHDVAVRRELERFRGREVKTIGDGFLATFDGPARAVRCATAIGQALRPLGLDVRAEIGRAHV